MNRKKVKISNPTRENGLGQKMDHLENVVVKLAKTVDDLAEAIVKGFATTSSKDDLKELEIKIECLETKFDMFSNDINNILNGHIDSVRNDYDNLTSRVKKLEITR